MANITVDLWQDFDFTTLDTTNLAANDHVSGGTWSITNSGELSTSTLAEKISTALISGNSDSGGTRGLRYDGPGTIAASSEGVVTYAPAASHASISFGFWFMFPAEYVGTFEGGQPDILYVENVLGTNEIYVKLVDGVSAGGQSSLILFTAEAGESATIDIEPDTWYWVTAVYGTTHKLRVYDESGSLVGSEQTRTGSAQDVTQASLGNLIGDEGGGGPFDFDDWVWDWTDATFPLGPPIASGTVEQEGFRWGIDDDTESAHTWEAAEDTNIATEVAQSRLLRLVLNATDDPEATAYALRYQKNGSGGYVAVPVGATTKTTPVIESADATESGNNTASGSWAVSYPNASAGDLLIFCISWDDSTATTDVSEPAGPNGETLSEVNATPATDAGTAIRCKVWYTKATGTWTASTLTFTPSANEQWTASVIRVPAGEFDSTTPIGASDTEGAASDGANIQHGAFSAGATDGNGKLCVWTAADVNPQTVASGFSQVSNTDRGAVSGGFFTRDTAVSDSESFSATTVSTMTAEGWATVAFVVRAPTVTNEIYVTTSSNIAAGGEATTARLTAPSGKSGQFTTGRRWDDENGSYSIDIVADQYTEVEWSLTTQSPATNDDYFEFRVYSGSAPLETYSVTPKWTIGTAGASGFFPLLERPVQSLQTLFRALKGDAQLLFPSTPAPGAFLPVLPVEMRQTRYRNLILPHNIEYPETPSSTVGYVHVLPQRNVRHSGRYR